MYRPFAIVRNCRESGSADNCHSRARSNGSRSRCHTPGQVRGAGRLRYGRTLPQGLPHLREQLMADHVVADICGAGEAFSIGRAMAFDDNAVEAEEYSAIGLARIHLVIERAKRTARQQVTKLRRERAPELALEDLAELARRALGSLERDIAGKALRHNHIHRSLADIIAFHEAEIIELRPFALAQ